MLFRIRQPKVRNRESDGKPITYLESPKDFALFDVMKRCLKQTITKQVGYEAKLANVTYKFSSVEEMAVRIKITGYSEKLLQFAELFIDIMLGCAKPGGFEH